MIPPMPESVSGRSSLVDKMVPPRDPNDNDDEDEDEEDDDARTRGY
jgi:hypothetical protein